MDMGDDEIVGASGGTKPRLNDLGERVIPQVVDATGEQVQKVFEEFLELFVLPPDAQDPLSSAQTQGTTDKYYIAQIHGLRVYNLSTLYIDYQHLLTDPKYHVLADAIRDQVCHAQHHSAGPLTDYCPSVLPIPS